MTTQSFRQTTPSQAPPPAQTAPGEAARAPGTLPAVAAADPTDAAILLVDDHRENLTALDAVLEPLGQRLLSAASGEQALRALLREEVAVILLDVRMVGLDGLETARIIRSRPATRHIPIIFLTAQASDVEAVAEAYASGAVDYVVKPFKPEILRAKVSVFVELHRERAERVRQSQARADAEAVARTVRTLQILSDTALAHLEMDRLSVELLERTRTLFGAATTALLMRNDSAPGLLVQAQWGTPALLEDRLRVVPGVGALGTALLERRPMLIAPEECAAGELAAGGALRSVAAIPLMSGNGLIGLLMLGAIEADHFTTADLEVLALAADRMALALDHAQRFGDGRQLVETLQRSLLPDRLPHNPRLRLAVRYLPGGLAPQVGGDWYDSLELDADRTALMIGDVVGHGVRAATTMSELRNALRAFAVEGHGPAEALHQLDRVVHRTFGPGMIATVLFLIIDVAAGTVRLARAGHLPPAVRRADGTVRYLEAEGGLPLGVDDGQTVPEGEFPFGPGDTLVLFTDGLVERREEDLDAGMRRLRESLAAAPSDVESVCDHILAGTIGEQPSRDDAALLTVRFTPPSVTTLQLTLPAQPDSVRLARHRLRSWLHVTVPELERVAQSDFELILSEACSNVVRHAYGAVQASFAVSARRDGDEVELQVCDSGRWRPPRGSFGGRGLGLMRELCDELAIDRRGDGTIVTMRRRVHPPAPAPA